MYEQLRQNITRKVSLTNSEFEQIEAVVKPLSIRKKSRVLTAGEICNYTIFVNKGCLRSFSVNSKGVESIVQFAFEDNWISDLYSYVSEAPSLLHIESVEDCDLLLLYKEDMENLFNKIPMLERWKRLLLQNAYVAVQRRLNSSLSVTAEERYAELLHSHPDIANRVPLIHIASYLGITPESLSRIRRQLLTK
ncbi:cAMP-binding domain of CRP or a regulatory subunit of cAMP-dependent protein kinases [Filimonas lacunae]|uniref:cAMP-binding domain of CRP or a regulatory subunit of cAMP-dependent protein kinases n=1 Tax=Filimonas lacunae TaxID=477680 RepID=A0A173MQJ8_9BACT|nr:Crp/Fnr family transcriptional regulator [Filimonas lacunae]BAV09766.1 Crp/Fnr family transcriptional regulator [Filimonas lacunae]SIS78690.1 cAMP-binding domain of CRP or a regulatory subunit of cAMP-dependent protein kinases [Filimonas lacunae]